MKKLKSIIFLPLVLIALSSCSLRMSDNGDLDGNWQLTAVDTMATGGVRQMKESGTFWAFQFDMLQLRNGINIIDMRFNHDGDALIVNDPYIDDRPSGDQKLEDVEMLRPYGINALEEHFYVRCLDSEQMILESEKLILYFRKF